MTVLCRHNMPISPLAQINGIEVHRGPSMVLNRASVTIGLGEVVSVIGDNGSGKTTLIESLLESCH